MPGVYRDGEHDIAGCITGVVEKDNIITGEKIREGDVILGFTSSGLHTNGFSLARKILFTMAGHTVETQVSELGMTVGEALLKIHVNYSRPVLDLLDAGVDIRGIAHITGGGFLENIPRVLSDKLDAEITLGTWPMLPIFPYMQKIGNVEQEEMYKVFNMGIGLILVVPKEAETIVREKLSAYPDYPVYTIGTIINGSGKVILK